jgi:hypothetical protein
MAAHTDLGTWGEHYVAGMLSNVAPVKDGKRADLRVLGLEVEVKTARPSKAERDRKHPRYQFCLRREGHHTDMHGDILVLVLADTGECYVIPRDDVPNVRILKLGPQTERLSPYLENWEVIADLVEQEEARCGVE